MIKKRKKPRGAGTPIARYYHSCLFIHINARALQHYSCRVVHSLDTIYVERLCLLFACLALFFRRRKQAANHSEGFVLVFVRGCSGGVKVVHLRSVVVCLGVGVEPQLVVFPCEYPQEVRVIAEPEYGRRETRDGRRGRRREVGRQNVTACETNDHSHRQPNGAK